jgi:hypothetical protein
MIRVNSRHPQANLLFLSHPCYLRNPWFKIWEISR